MEDALTLGGAVLVVGALSFSVAGPLGMLVLGMVLLALGVVAPGGSGTRTERRNCLECGAVNPTDSDACHYCAAPLDT